MGTLCVGCNAQNPNVTVVTPSDFKTAVETDANGILLDVRKPDEFAEGHLKGAKLINWLDGDSFKKEAENLDKTKTVYVYCRSGRRSNSAANYLADQGFKVVDMKGGIMAWKASGLPTTVLDSDIFFTGKGKRVEITFIKHGTLMIDAGGYCVHIDPVLMFGTDYSKLPKADLVLVTHEHGDHFDKTAVEQVWKDGTVFLSNGKVAELSKKSEAMKVGETKQFGALSITAAAAYNISPGHEKFHPKGRDVGFILDIDDLRIYVAGDTEEISELAELKDVDIAFLPVNQPYTMTAAQCIKAIEMFSPKIVYPYHYGETDLKPIVEHFKGKKDIEVRIRRLE
mgnify:FL=1